MSDNESSEKYSPGDLCPVCKCATYPHCTSLWSGEACDNCIDGACGYHRKDIWRSALDPPYRARTCCPDCDCSEYPNCLAPTDIEHSDSDSSSDDGSLESLKFEACCRCRNPDGDHVAGYRKLEEGEVDSEAEEEVRDAESVGSSSSASEEGEVDSSYQEAADVSSLLSTENAKLIKRQALDEIREKHNKKKKIVVLDEGEF